MPKTFNLNLLDVLPEYEIESVFQDLKLKFFCVYFGDLIRKTGKSELKV